MRAIDLIAFMHIYKCGGTTFNWVLQRAFPGHVLYCENSPPENKHIEKSQLNAYREKADSTHTALSSHLIRYEALSSFNFVVTILREPAKRILSAYNFDAAREVYSGDLDSYIECRKNHMSWALGNDFISNVNSDRIFCCVLEDFDLSMVSLEHLLAIHGHKVDLAAPKVLNAGKEKNKNHANLAKSLSFDQMERIRHLNKEDYDLYSSQLAKFKEFSMAIPNLADKMNDYKKRKEEALNSIPSIKSYGQGPNHFTYI